MSELKPCPLCGSVWLRKSDDMPNAKYRAVECRDCGAQWHTTTAGNFNGWNTRPIEDGLIAEVNRLNNVIDRTIVVWENRVIEKENEISKLNAWIDELIKRGNEVAFKAYIHRLDAASREAVDFDNFVSHIRKERRNG